MHVTIKVPGANASEKVLSVTSPFDGSVETFTYRDMPVEKMAVIRSPALK